jgi:hypothetical protein
MSYWISLNDSNGCTVEVDWYREGGTFALGGSTDADMNITYNYSRLFPFRDLHRKRAGDTIDQMQEAVDRLGTDYEDDYWAHTAGNAGYAVSILLDWARQHPDAVWEVR